MDAQETFKRALRVVALDEKEMNTLVKDKNALKPALVIIGLFSLIAAFGFLLFPPTILPGIAFYRPDILTTVLHAVTTFIIFTAMFFVVGFFAEKVFNSKLDMHGFVKVLGFGQLVGFISIFPQLALLAWLWSFIIFLFVTRKLAGLDWGSIILLLVFAAVVLLILQAVLSTLGLPILNYTYDYTIFERFPF